MFKQLFKFSAAFLLTTVLYVAGTMASGKMEVPLGQRVILEVDDVTSAAAGEAYKWAVTKDQEIVTTQSGNVFNYIFDQQGEYKVNLTAETQGGDVRNTTVSIMVGGRYSKPAAEQDVFDQPLAANFNTLPQAGPDDTVHILGQEGRVAFDIEYRVDVLEFRLDKNIYVDSDGNGIPDDDIDNESDRSYLTGGLWNAEYAPTESAQIAAQLTVVNTAGKTAKKQVNIVFDNFLPGQGEVLAILDTLPPTQESKITVYGESDTVAFYGRRSQGNVLEYRIDADIFTDSDGDGDPANDIDNRNDDSFKTGDVWTHEYQKTEQKIMAQFTVVGEGGLGSQIQREVVFAEAPISQVPSGTAPSGISLVADKPFVQKGDPINFRVEGLTQALENYTFEWDFNGDAEIDKETEGIETTSYIYDTPGLQQVSVRVQDKDGNVATFTKEVEVKDAQSTAANFEFKVDGLTVNFTNTSTASDSLANQALTYKWSFGDPDEQNYIAQQDKLGLENPSYTYVKAGTYQVTLAVTDVDQVSDSKTLEVEVGGAPTEGAQGQPETEKTTSVLGGVFKVILYVVLGLIGLVLLMIAGFLIYLKIKHPDLVFEELIDEFKIKILSLLGVHEEIETEEQANTPGMANGSIPPYKPQQQKVTPKPVPKEPVSAPPKAAAPDLSQADGKTPDWLKPKDQSPQTPSQKPVIEGEVVTPKPSTPPPAPSNSQAPSSGQNPANGATPGAQPPKDLKKSDGPVPDWLKDA